MLNHFERRRRLPVRAQESTNDCGPTCLEIILRYHGIDSDISELRRSIDPDSGGISARKILNSARDHGLEGRGIRIEMKNVHRLPTGTLLFWKNNHFVVLERTTGRYLHIVDPAFGRRKLPLELAADMFTGIALDFQRRAATPVPSEEEREKRRNLLGHSGSAET